MSNYLTVFSNGMAHFTRTLPPMKEKTVVKIPVKRKSLSDALATLAIFGNVQITDPPSYPVIDGDQVLTIDSDNITKQLVRKLSGARVEIEERGGTSTTGILAGREQYDEQVAGAVVEHYKIGVYGEDGSYHVFGENDVKSIKFLDANVRQEIKNALERNYATINPESTYISVGITPNSENKDPVLYQMVIPLSAWQPVYQLRLKDGKCELEASAKVDNPTDEDLNDYIISVVTGDPNTFPTDLADVRKPLRKKVNIISDQATGAVSADDSIQQFASGGLETMDYVEVSRAEQQSSRLQNKNLRAALGGAPPPLVDPESFCPSPRAQQTTSTSTDVGDFAIYTSKNPVNISSKHSAIIPLFQENAEGKVLLLYKESECAKRPFRAVKFKNTTTHSLGKGGCTVYTDDTYQGQVVLEATKPNEERTLPHARENGVKVFKNPPGSKGGTTSQRRSRIEIINGVAVVDNVSTHETVYCFVNSKTEDFNLEIEHQRQIGDARTVFEVTGSSLPFAVLENGLLIPCKLPSKGQLEVHVRESYTLSQSVVIYQNAPNFQWFLNNLIANTTNPPEKFLQNKKIVKVIELQEKLVKAKELQGEAEERVRVLTKEQTRKLELVKVGKGSQVDAWGQELAVNEKAIYSCEHEMIPTLQKAVKAAEAALSEALKDLSVTWVEDAK